MSMSWPNKRAALHSGQGSVLQVSINMVKARVCASVFTFAVLIGPVFGAVGKRTFRHPFRGGPVQHSGGGSGGGDIDWLAVSEVLSVVLAVVLAVGFGYWLLVRFIEKSGGRSYEPWKARRRRAAAPYTGASARNPQDIAGYAGAARL